MVCLLHRLTGNFAALNHSIAAPIPPRLIEGRGTSEESGWR
jgi:hypothetical protein